MLGQLVKAGGTMLGGSLGGAPGAALGSAAAGMFNNITGMGDYGIAENTIMTDNKPVTMHSDNGTVRVRHTEFITVVKSSTGFSYNEYNLNPGLAGTFPWLANLAQGFQTYDIEGCVVMYKPLSAMAVGSTNTSLGVVVIATQYDVDAPSFHTRREMESYMYTTSSVPFEHQIHPVECAPNSKVLEEQYIRYGSVTEDKRWSDLGRVTVATEGMQSADDIIGELWITYDVRLCKPRIVPSGYGVAQYAHLQAGPYNNTEILGAIQLPIIGPLELSVSATGAGYDTISFPPGLAEGYFFIGGLWRGSSTASCSLATTLTNCTAQSYWSLDTTNSHFSSGTQSEFFLDLVVRIDDVGAAIQLGTATLPASGTSIDLWVMQIGHEGSVQSLVSLQEEEKEDWYDLSRSQLIRRMRSSSF